MTARRRHVLLRADDQGSVTAEFAVALPAVLAVLALVLGGIMLAGRRIELVSAAAELARLEARGDRALAADREQRLPRSVRVLRDRDGALACVSLSAAPGAGLLSLIEVSARSCAAVHPEASTGGRSAETAEASAALTKQKHRIEADERLRSLARSA